jgi:hypothetical protein
MDILQNYLTKANQANKVALGVGAGTEAASLIMNLTNKYEHVPKPLRSLPEQSFTDFEAIRMEGQKGIDRGLNTALRASKESNLETGPIRSVVGAMEAGAKNDMTAAMSKTQEQNTNRIAAVKAINTDRQSIYQNNMADWQGRSQFAAAKGEAISNNLSNISNLVNQNAQTQMKMLALTGGNDIMKLKAEYETTTDPVRRMELYQQIKAYGSLYQPKSTSGKEYKRDLDPYTQPTQ